MAQSTARVAGSSPAFIAICAITLGWLASGPLFHWSDTWQLVINTVTNIVSMLMVFLIQNTQNRESTALQLKVDELLRAVRGAQKPLDLRQRERASLGVFFSRSHWANAERHVRAHETVGCRVL